MKRYLVLYKYYTTVVVEAEDCAHAYDITSSINTPSGVDLDDIRIERELLTDEEVAREIKNSPMHQWDSQKVPYSDQ